MVLTYSRKVYVGFPEHSPSSFAQTLVSTTLKHLTLKILNRSCGFERWNSPARMDCSRRASASSAAFFEASRSSSSRCRLFYDNVIRAFLEETRTVRPPPYARRALVFFFVSFWNRTKRGRSLAVAPSRAAAAETCARLDVLHRERESLRRESRSRTVVREIETAYFFSRGDAGFFFCLSDS